MCVESPFVAQINESEICPGNLPKLEIYILTVDLLKHISLK